MISFFNLIVREEQYGLCHSWFYNCVKDKQKENWNDLGAVV